MRVLPTLWGASCRKDTPLEHLYYVDGVDHAERIEQIDVVLLLAKGCTASAAPVLHARLWHVIGEQSVTSASAQLCLKQQ